MLSRNKIKYIQSLSIKKFRDIHQCFIAETPKVVNEFLNSSYNTGIILGLEKWIEDNRQYIGSGTEVIPVTEIELGKISQLKHPHSVLAVVAMKRQEVLPDISNTITLALDDLQDPGNMGTIIRIADWFGIKNIICSRNTADAYNPKVIQASMGSLARINVIYTDLENFIEKTKIPVFAAAMDGISIYSKKNIKNGIIVIGNEGKGINSTILSKVKEKITIPRIGKAESLNAAVATAIILSHLTEASKPRRFTQT